jgi:hypothetical protein
VPAMEEAVFAAEEVRELAVEEAEDVREVVAEDAAEESVDAREERRSSAFWRVVLGLASSVIISVW